MSRFDKGISRIEELEVRTGDGRYESPVHPLVLTLFTLCYIILTVSFPKYALSGVLLFFTYPIAVFILSDLPLSMALRRVLTVLPLILVIGIVNPFLDRGTAFTLFGMPVSYGMLSFLTLTLKGILAVLAAFILIAFVGIEGIVYALRLVRVPEVLTTVLLLIYRYITLIAREAAAMSDAYKLRAPGQRGIAFKNWGSFAGQLLLRSYDRAGVLYESMLLRGYNGTFPAYGERKARAWEIVLFALLAIAYLLLRIFMPAELFGGLLK